MAEVGTGESDMKLLSRFKWYRDAYVRVENLAILAREGRTLLQQLGEANDANHAEILRMSKRLRAATKIHADISPTARGTSEVIIVSRLAGRDHVQIFQFYNDNHMREVLLCMKEMQRNWYGNVVKIDCGPGGMKEYFMDQLDNS